MLPAIERIKEESRRKAKLPRCGKEDHNSSGTGNQNTPTIPYQRLPAIGTIQAQHLQCPQQEHRGHHNCDLGVTKGCCGGRQTQNHDLTRRGPFGDDKNTSQNQRSEYKAESHDPMFIDTNGHMERGQCNVDY